MLASQRLWNSESHISIGLQVPEKNDMVSEARDLSLTRHLSLATRSGIVHK